MSQDSSPLRGTCLCGGVQYQVQKALGPVVYCHCQQCQQASGHYCAASACSPDALQIQDTQTLRWYRSSEKAQRGFCINCGANLFWRADHGRYVSVMVGTLKSPADLVEGCHIFVDEAPPHYKIADGLEQFAQDYPDSRRSEFE